MSARYTLGLILYQLLTGVRAFADGTDPLAEAEPLLRRAWTTRETALGAGHAEVEAAP